MNGMEWDGMEWNGMDWMDGSIGGGGGGRGEGSTHGAWGGEEGRRGVVIVIFIKCVRCTHTHVIYIYMYILLLLLHRRRHGRRQTVNIY